MAGTECGDADTVQILRLLGLERVTVAPELLRLVGARFRPPQQAQLLATLRTLGDDNDPHDDDRDENGNGGGSGGAKLALERLAAHFDRKLDVWDELEWFLHDLLKMLHFVASATASKDGKAPPPPAVRDPRVLLFASLGDQQDRDRLAKVFQSLGAPASAAYCRVASTLPPKYLQELLRQFADDLPALQTWMKWLVSLRGVNHPSSIQQQPRRRPFEMAAEFMGRCVREQCLPIWLSLLQPLDSPGRLAAIIAAFSLPVTSPSAPGAPAVGATASSLKKLAQFLEATAMSPLKLLEVDESVRRTLPLFLDEFPTVTLQSVLSKFGSNAALVELITQRGLMLLGKTGLLHLLESLTAPAVSPQAADVFLAALFAFKRLHVLLTLFFRLETASRLSIIQLTVRVQAASTEREASDGDQSDGSAAARLFDLLLASSQDRDVDTILRSLAVLPPELVVEMLDATASATEPDDDSTPNSELAVLGECLEMAADPVVLTLILPIFLLLTHEARVLLVAWLHDVSDSSAQPVYHVLRRLLCQRTNDPVDANVSENAAGRVLEMLSGLHARDKLLLCREILRGDGAAAGGEGNVSVDEQVLLFLTDVCDDDGSRRRKMLRLLRLIPREEHSAFLLLLRTQSAAQQEALMRLMRSLPIDANLRLLRQVTVLPTDTIDALFELLLLVPKAECPALAKLLTSVNVATAQLHTLVTVAADMKNQAASRELVMFAADLPPETRAFFFDVLADKVPEKGVLLRMMSLSSRVSLPLLCRLVQLLHHMGSWEVRSAFVEQLRSLELEHEIEEAVNMLCELEVGALRWAVTLLSPFAAPIRVTFSRLMLQLGATTERRGVLAKLVEIPKNRIGEFMAAVCDAQCAPVSAGFLRVVGKLEPQFQFPLLSLLQKEAWWFFVQLMAVAAHEADELAGGDNSMREGKPHDTVNAVASVLVRFVGDDSHLALFRNVVEHALACSVTLYSLVAVVTPFIDNMERHLALLRYVYALGARRRAATGRVPLLFRVLAQCSQPVLVFSICRIADVDDAMFALQRLDRMLQRDEQRRVEVQHALERIARQANRAGGVDASVVDAFFNFVRRFRELEPQHNDDALSGADRVVTPRNNSEFSRPTSCSPAKSQSQQRYHMSELSLDENFALEAAQHLNDKLCAVPQTSPQSCRRVALERHVRHALLNGEGFPRKRSTRRNWWQEMEHVDLILAPELVSLSTSVTAPDAHIGSHVTGDEEDSLTVRVDEGERDETTRQASAVINETSAARAPSPRALPPVSRTSAAQFGRHKPKARPVHPTTTEPAITALSSSNIPIHVHEKPQSKMEPRHSAHQRQLDRCDDLTHTTDERRPTTTGDSSQLGDPTSHPSTTLATGSSHETSQNATATPETHNQHLNVTFVSSTTASNAVRQLARSESAPESLELREWTSERQRAKHMRGLCGGLEQDPQYHIERDCAARILRKQCQDAYAHSAVRIRFSKTPAAQSRILQARVRRVLGQRQLPAVDASQRPSALVRPDRLTMERAASVLALSEQHRTLTHSLSTTDAFASGTILHERSAAATRDSPAHSPVPVSSSL